MSNESINAEEKQETLSISSSAVPNASVKVANLRAMCYTFISFALWLETQSHGVHSVFVFHYVEFSFLLRCEMQNRRYI